MDELLFEDRVSFTRLAQEQHVSVPTVWRWAQRGIKGHVLESFSVGGRRYTTREAFARFIARTNGQRVVNGQTPRQREAAIRRAERRAAELGV
jgi:hypothetical protein